MYLVFTCKRRRRHSQERVSKILEAKFCHFFDLLLRHAAAEQPCGALGPAALPDARDVPVALAVVFLVRHANHRGSLSTAQLINLLFFHPAFEVQILRLHPRIQMMCQKPLHLSIIEGVPRVHVTACDSVECAGQTVCGLFVG